MSDTPALPSPLDLGDQFHPLTHPNRRIHPGMVFASRLPIPPPPSPASPPPPAETDETAET